MEQLYPTPLHKLSVQLRRYPNLKNIVWVQEEPKNMGGFQHVYFKISDLLAKEGWTNLRLHYVGRPERSSPATGSVYRHKIEQEKIVKELFAV
jgi:2-oxoglutarate dehydrogenase E1 component